MGGSGTGLAVVSAAALLTGGDSDLVVIDAAALLASGDTTGLALPVGAGESDLGAAAARLESVIGGLEGSALDSGSLAGPGRGLRDDPAHRSFCGSGVAPVDVSVLGIGSGLLRGVDSYHLPPDLSSKGADGVASTCLCWDLARE